MKIAVGVDAHNSTFAIVAISAVGVELDSFSVPATPEGFSKGHNRIGNLQGMSRGVSREGTRAGLVSQSFFRDRVLSCEVSGSVTKRHRRQGTQRGKSGPIDGRANRSRTLTL